MDSNTVSAVPHPAGLYEKYNVFRSGQEGAESIDGCFVLRPATDSTAWSAVAHYADNTGNLELARDLWRWLADIGHPSTWPQTGMEVPGPRR